MYAFIFYINFVAFSGTSIYLLGHLFITLFICDFGCIEHPQKRCMEDIVKSKFGRHIGYNLYHTDSMCVTEIK